MERTVETPLSIYTKFILEPVFLPLSQWIFVLVSVTAAALCRVLLLGIGRKLYPLQLVAVHQCAGEGSVARLGAFGDKLHVYCLHLLLEVEVFEVFHARRVQHVAEVAQSFDVDALALAHAGVHCRGDVAQHGLHVGVRVSGLSFSPAEI